MKKFLEKNLGYILAAGLVLGMIIGFTGIAWDESDTKWKIAASPFCLWGGWGMFGVSALILAVATWGGSKKD